MKNDVVSKVNKIGKAGVIITNIGKVFLWIGLIVCILSGLLLMAIPDDFIVIHMEGKAAVEVNFPAAISQSDFYVIEEDGVGELKWNDVTWGEVDGTLDLEVNGQEYGVVGMVKTENGYLMDAMADTYTIKATNFASVVFLAAVFCAVTLVTNSVMSGNVNIVIGVDLMTVLLVLLVFMLSAIFNYGTLLQQESDETL